MAKILKITKSNGEVVYAPLSAEKELNSVNKAKDRKRQFKIEKVDEADQYKETFPVAATADLHDEIAKLKKELAAAKKDGVKAEKSEKPAAKKDGEEGNNEEQK